MGVHALAKTAGGSIGAPRAALRTAVKLLPWEMVHVSAFALSEDLGSFTVVQAVGLVTANALMLLYLLVVLATCGSRSVHDFVTGTFVAFR